MIKKNLVIIALVALCVSVNAQDKPLTFGVKAGVNLSNIGGDAEGGDDKIGFQVGATLDYALGSDWYLLSGLGVSTKGYKVSDETANAIYLELPIHAGYKVSVSDAATLVVEAGPYLAYGIGGKMGDIKYFDVAKKFDFGVGLGAGVEFGQFAVKLGYDFGLANVSKESDYKVKNLNAYLTVGYKF